MIENRCRAQPLEATLVIGHAFLIDAAFQNGSPYFLGQLFSASLRNSQFVYRIFTDQHDVSISHDDCLQSHKHMTEPSSHELN